MTVHLLSISFKVLAIEIYKIIDGLSQKRFTDCFKLNNVTPYKTRNSCTLYSQSVRTALLDPESLSHLGLNIWKIVN